MSNGWPMVRLGDALKLCIDAVPVDSTTEYEMCGVYSFGRGLFEREPLSGANTTYKVMHRLHEGDFVLSQPKGWEGALSKITEEHNNRFLSPVFSTFRPVPTKLYIEYLDWYCKQGKVWKQLRVCKLTSSAFGRAKAPANREVKNLRTLSGIAQGMGARRDSVHPLKFLGLEIPLPPLAEQKRIVGRIEELAGKIEEARSLRGEVAKDIKALTISLHLDLAANRHVRLSDIIELYEEQTTIEPGTSYPQVGVRGFGQGLFPKEAVLAGETTYRHFNYLYQGAIVLSQVKGWEGGIGVCPEKLVGWFSSPEYRTFRCLAGKANPEYLSYIFKNPWFLPFLQKATRGVGARRERTRPEQFLNIQIPMPAIDEQIKAVSILKRCEETHRIGTKMCVELDSLMPAVLDKAFRGLL